MIDTPSVCLTRIILYLGHGDDSALYHQQIMVTFRHDSLGSFHCGRGHRESIMERPDIMNVGREKVFQVISMGINSV